MNKPELPKPARTFERNYFTEAQMLAYRAEVIEMCAKVCDDKDCRLGDKYQGDTFATALRSLK